MGRFETSTIVALTLLFMGYACMGAGAAASMAGSHLGCGLAFLASAGCIAIAIGIAAARWIREAQQDAEGSDLLVRLAKEGTLDSFVREARRKAAA